MNRTQVILLTAVSALSLFALGVNLKLHLTNVRLRQQLSEIIAPELATAAPAIGWPIPQLNGMIDGTAAGIDLQHSYHSMVLVVFSPINCPVCEANWKYWSRLLVDPDRAHLLMFITSAHSISEGYLQSHQMQHSRVMFDLGPGILKQMRMETVPQTILLESGTVKKVWFGLLSDADVEAIGASIQVDE
jgi:hypothetical protein